jgi:Xaa-Pro aminopeptidase
MQEVFRKRWEKVDAHLDDKKTDAFVIANPHNIRYLTCPEIRYVVYKPYPITCLIKVKNEEPIAIAPYMEANIVREEFPALEVLTFSEVQVPDILTGTTKSEEIIRKIINEKKLKNIICDQPMTNIAEQTDNFVESIRAIKDPYEIECIKTAETITIKASEKIKDIIEEGKSELQIANELEYTLKKLGAPFTYFDPIIASGKHAANGHHQPSEKKIEKGDVVVCDFGAFYKGYGADITRTYFVGNISEGIIRAYQAVCESVQAGIDCVQKGVQYSRIDEACNNILKNHGLEKFRWVSGSGHGIGIEVHERPRIGPYSADVVEEGHVFTIEPGVYMPGKLGIRIEDNILVYEGIHNLTSIEKRLEEFIL